MWIYGRNITTQGNLPVCSLPRLPKIHMMAWYHHKYYMVAQRISSYFIRTNSKQDGHVHAMIGKG